MLQPAPTNMVSINDTRVGSRHPRVRDALWELPDAGTQTFRYLDPKNAGNGAGANASTPLLEGAAKPAHLLGQLPATAISGNDIMSSCLYVSGFAAFYAGFYAPVCLFLVSGITLYLFRGIYTEVVTALPVNGGTYTVLLNTTSKAVASIAACLTLLSYASTAVVSAFDAVSYAQNLWEGLSDVWGPVVVLAIFALLCFVGLKESATVATAIFVVHMIVLTMLCCDSFYTAVDSKFSILVDNFHKRHGPLNVTSPDHPDGGHLVALNSLGKALLLGFSASMLGITGFETSANYVEEQAPGVFPKTLRNMWLMVAIYNPLISILSLSVLPLETVMGYPLDDTGNPTNTDLLQKMASTIWLRKLVSIDAFLVLCGSVLTSYVGVGGLIHRMSLDRVLPSVLLVENTLFHSRHVVIFGFFAVCTSLFFIVNRQVLILGSIYAVAFLCVMALFAIGNVLLKYKRRHIRREYKAHIVTVLCALVAVVTAIYGNIRINFANMKFFLLYYGLTLLCVFIMFQRVRILKILLRVARPSEPHDVTALSAASHHALEQPRVRRIEDEDDDLAVEPMPGGPDMTKLPGWRGLVVRFAVSQVRAIKAQKMVFFIKRPDISLMNKAVVYVRDNEQTFHLSFMHLFEPDESDPKADMTDTLGSPALVEATTRPELAQMVSDLELLQRVYPKMRLDFVGLGSSQPFDGSLTRAVSDMFAVPPHFMFIACPSQRFSHDIASLGGVRVITL